MLPNCKTHNKSCNVYCSKCDQIMCDLCFLQEHKGHFSQDEGVKKFITIKNEYDKTISQIKKINRTIEEKKNDIITKINKYADERKVELNEFIKNEKNEIKCQLGGVVPAKMYCSDLQQLKNQLIELKRRISQNDQNYQEIFDLKDKIKSEFERLKKEINTNNIDKQLSLINLNSIIPPYIYHRLVFKVKDIFGKVKSQLLFKNNNYKWQVVLSKIERPCLQDEKDFELLVFISPILRRMTINCKATIKSANMNKEDHKVEGELIFDCDERNNRNIEANRKTKTALNLNMTVDELINYYSSPKGENGYTIIIDFYFKFDYYSNLFINNP